jgi:excinuclease ABC subunit C
VQKVETVRALAPELVRPLSQLRAVILQASPEPDEVAVFLFENGRLRGPGAFSTIGMRIQNEQSGSSSLFAQPLAVEAIPEETSNMDQGSGVRDLGTEIGDQRSVTRKVARTMLEARMEAVLAELSTPTDSPSSTIRQGHLALLKRWYYRPEAKRSGEIFFPYSEGMWPIKAVLRGVGRVAAKSLTTAPAS